MKTEYIKHYKTDQSAHARINQLEAQLGLPLSGADDVLTLDEKWDKIEALEARLTAQGAKATTTASVPPTRVPEPVTRPKERSTFGLGDSPKGLNRAIQANINLQRTRQRK